MKYCILVFFILMFCNVRSHATLTVNADPSRHDRFYSGADRDFLGESYDWSGVGMMLGASPKWATMISDSFFVSANHSRPNGNSNPIRFYYGNDPALGYEERTLIWGELVGGSGDLFVGQLSAPLSQNIARYAVLDPADAPSLTGEKVLLFGQTKALGNGTSTDPALFEQMTQNQRLARNTYARSSSITWGWTYDLPRSNDALGDDEAIAVQGDSGSPTFALVENQPTLVGTRWFTTGDMSVLSRAAQLDAAVQTRSGGAEHVTFVSKPTMSILPLLVEDFQADTPGTAPVRGPMTVTQVINDSGAGRQVQVVSQGIGNNRLQLSSESAAFTDRPFVFLESIATGISSGRLSMDVEVASSGFVGDGRTLFQLLAGDDDASNVIAAATEAVFQIDFLDNQHLQINTGAGVYQSDQTYSFDQPMTLDVIFNTLGSLPSFSVLLDNVLLTSQAGALRQFAPTSDVARLDAIFAVAVGQGDAASAVATHVYLDNINLTATASGATIPEPTSLFWCGAGLFLGVARRWRA